MNQNQNNNQRQWEQVSGGDTEQGIRWEPQKNPNFNTEDPSNVIQGYFKDLLDRVGPKGVFQVALITVLDPSTGQLSDTYNVAGGTVLNEKLAEIPLGTYICIKYTGKVKSKSGNTYNSWEIYKDLNAVPFNQLGGHVKASAPAAQAPVFNNQGAQAPVFNNQGAQAPFNNQSPAIQQPVFNNQGTQAPAVQQQAPVFQQPQFTPPVQQQAPPVQQQQYIPPVQQSAPPVQQQAPPVANNSIPQGNPIFGANMPNDDLPY